MPRSIHSRDYRTLTAILVAARTKAGLTQQDVADRLGKPQSYVSKIERGERRIDLVEFIALARALDADPLRLFKQVLREVGADGR